MAKRSLTESFKDARSRILTERRSGLELEWLEAVICTGDAQQMLNFLERGKIADVGRQKSGCTSCNTSLTYEQEKRNSRTWSRARVEVGGPRPSRNCHVCRCWFCDECCKYEDDLTSFVLQKGDDAAQKGRWFFGRRTPDMKVKSCYSCHTFINARQWRLSQRPECLRPSSQHLLHEYKSLTMKMTQLVFNMAQAEGFLRHPDLLPDTGDAVSRDCKDVLKMIRRKAAEPLQKATSSLADIEATIKRLEWMWICRHDPPRDKNVRDAIIRTAKTFFKEKKLRIGILTEALKSAEISPRRQFALRDATNFVPRSVENNAVGGRYEGPLFTHEVEIAISKALREAAERRDPYIAVIGGRGVGKSSFINSVRGMMPTHPLAAEVDVDEVVTEDQLGYGALYRDAGLLYKDVPGCNGNMVDVSNGPDYIERFELDKADCCLFFYTDVLNGESCRCALDLHRRGIAVLFVRNKVDIHCVNAVQDGKSSSEQATLESMRNKAKEQLRAKGCEKFADDDHVFLISSKYDLAVGSLPPRFDFERLKTTLQGSIRDGVKRTQVEHIFQKNSKELASCRAKECSPHVCEYIVAAAITGSIPIPGLSQVSDIIILVQASHHFQRVFCLSEAQLQGGPLAAFGAYLTTKLATTIPARFAVSRLASGVADGIAWVPVCGISLSVVLGSAISATGMWLTLQWVVRNLEEIATSAYEIVMTTRLDRMETAEQELRALADRLFPQTEYEDMENDLTACAF